MLTKVSILLPVLSFNKVNNSIAMKTILVPTDFSSAARNAADYAIELAKEWNAQIKLLHVYALPYIPTDPPVPISSYIEEQKLDADQRLLEEQRRLQKNTAVSISYEARLNTKSAEILEAELAKDVKLIVMGTKHPNPLDEYIFGNTTIDVTRKASKPVLLVPVDHTYNKLEKIGFACDLRSTGITEAIAVLKSFAPSPNKEVIVLNVRYENEPASEDSIKVGQQIDKQLAGVNHHFSFYEDNNLTHAIDVFIQTEKPDVLALVKHRYDLLGQLFHRSTVRTESFHCKIPLLSLPDMRKISSTYFFTY